MRRPDGSEESDSRRWTLPVWTPEWAASPMRSANKAARKALSSVPVLGVSPPEETPQASAVLRGALVSAPVQMLEPAPSTPAAETTNVPGSGKTAVDRAEQLRANLIPGQSDGLLPKDQGRIDPRDESSSSPFGTPRASLDDTVAEVVRSPQASSGRKVYEQGEQVPVSRPLIMEQIAKGHVEAIIANMEKNKERTGEVDPSTVVPRFPDEHNKPVVTPGEVDVSSARPESDSRVADARGEVPPPPPPGSPDLQVQSKPLQEAHTLSDKTKELENTIEEIHTQAKTSQNSDRLINLLQ